MAHETNEVHHFHNSDILYSCYEFNGHITRSCCLAFIHLFQCTFHFLSLKWETFDSIVYESQSMFIFILLILHLGYRATECYSRISHRLAEGRRPLLLLIIPPPPPGLRDSNNNNLLQHHVHMYLILQSYIW